MESEEKKVCVVFAGGGTGGHIYPGIAVAEELKSFAAENGVQVEIHWIGNSAGMDSSIVSKNLESAGGCISSFTGIPCGKLRRYFSLKNFSDIAKIFFGAVKSFFVLKKLHPAFVFSKGGFVSVPPCFASRILKIPYFTHECDFTPGLATKLNGGGAKKIFLSYGETQKYFSPSAQKKCVVTGNPVRRGFYENFSADGRNFLKIHSAEKPVLLVLGGSLGARQINDLVLENLPALKEKFIVVHQTGKKFAEENPQVMNSADENYKPFEFIHGEMISVIQASDVILSRAGANSLWECAVSAKPMILIPLEGSGTRGDQVDNAEFFERQNAAMVLCGKNATGENLLALLEKMTDRKIRGEFSANCKKICGGEKPALKIAKIMFGEIGK